MRGLREKPWTFRLALAAVTVVGGLNFAWQLGSSSLYVDEVQSTQVALAPIGHFLHVLAHIEVTPPAYFLGLHEWLVRLGDPEHDWVYRMPSVLGGIALVPAVGWLALRVLGRRGPALLAPLLCALSPFVLEHAQRAQGYVFVALGSAVAVAAVLEAGLRHRSGGGARGWVALSLVVAVVTLFTHYLALVAVGPLCAWLLVGSSGLPRRWCRAYAIVCAGALAVLAPLLIWQHSYFPGRTGVAASAALTGANFRRMLEVIFDGRVSVWPALGVAVTAVTVLAAGVELMRARGRRSAGIGPVELTAVIAVGGPLALVALSAAGGSAFWGHLMLTRYAAASAPFLFVLVAGGTFALRRAGILAAVAAIAVAVAGCVQSHRPGGFYFDARGVVAYVARAHEPGDAVIAPPGPVQAVPLLRYGLARLAPEFQGSPDALATVRAHRQPLWLISALDPGAPTSAAAILAIARPVLAREHYRALTVRVFAAVQPAVVVHAVPAGPP